MKKRFAVFIVVAVLLSGCGKTTSAISSVPPAASASQASSVISSVTSSAESTTVSYVTKPDDMSAAAFLRQNFPVTDGSTSTIPLDAAVRSAIFNTGLDYETGNVTHTTTFGSFERLLSGEVDLTYTVPLSAEQKQAAADAGVELKMVPIAREAFVFVLNAKNPVTSLTQEQLRGIYSGEITNWKQVGGNDAEIVAYQRNQTSGSQTYMTAFMGDTALMDPVETLVATSMGGLMDAIALYDNAENAIGYSVYAYAADMYGTGTELKFVAVDGISPDDTTMTDGTYPLLSENYAIFRASEPEGSPARVLAEWLTTEDGQEAVANGGYIPIGVDPSTVVARDNAWAEVGTGPKATGEETLPTSYYVANINETYYYGNEDVWIDGAYTVSPVDTSELNITSGFVSAGTIWDIKAEFTGLISSSKDAAITDFMNDAIAELAAQRSEYEAFLEELNRDEEELYPGYSAYTLGTQRHDEEGYYWESPIWIETTCYNGYLSVAVRLRYYSPYEGGTYDCRTAIFDLYTGKQVAFTDLFYEGTDIAALLNSAVKHYANGDLFWESGYAQIRQENPIVTDEVTDFALNYIYYPRENDCFAAGVGIEYDIFAVPSLVGVERDMDGLWKPSVAVYRAALTEAAGGGLRKNGVLSDEEKNFYAVEADAYVTQIAADKINAAVEDYIDTVHEKTLMDYYNATGMTRDEMMLYFASWMKNTLKSSLDAYLDEQGATAETILADGLTYNQNAPYVICGKCVVYPRAGAYFWSDFDYLESDYPYAFYLPVCLVFDVNTGERIQISQLYLDGWEQAATWYDISGAFYRDDARQEVDTPDIDDLVLVYLSWGDQNKTASLAVFMTQDGKTTYEVAIPGAYLNFD